MTNSLKSRIARHITMSGPLPLAEFMHWCMADDTDGYYKNAKPIGRSGDFITAPEVSQMFGELIGIWVLQTWEKLGKPKALTLAEIGPGNGTLMKDVLRATSISPDFSKAVQIHLIETSAQLRDLQQESINHDGVDWHGSIKTLPNHPTIFVANEFLDVLPVRQYVKQGEYWHERAVGLSKDNNLIWVLTDAKLEPSLLPNGAGEEPDGAVYEISNTREAFVANITEHLSTSTGAALFIDYGHAKTGFGDTFQALKSHEYVNPLTHPGEADLTSHVDFAALETIVRENKIEPEPMITQGEFLLQLGLLERAGQLGHGKSSEIQQRLTREAERLALPHEMGDLFKVFRFGNYDHVVDGS